MTGMLLIWMVQNYSADRLKKRKPIFAKVGPKHPGEGGTESKVETVQIYNGRNPISIGETPNPVENRIKLNLLSRKIPVQQVLSPLAWGCSPGR